MKKIYSLLLVALISVLSTTVWAETVSKEEAVQLATNFFSTKMETGAVMRAPASTTSTSLSLNNSLVTSLQGKKLANLPAMPTKTGMTAKSAGLPTDQLVVSSDKLTPRIVELPKSLGIDQFYVIQNEGGQGWMLLAANDVVQPILAYSETGTFRTDKMPENISYWLNGYNTQIKEAVESGLTASSEVTAEWSNLRKGARKAKQADVVVAQLIKTQWDQDAPYYNKCPKNNSNGQSVTGCVATAMAQVMKFWEWPNQGQGSHSYSDDTYGTQNVNFANATYDWANMKTYYNPYNSSSYTSDQANAVALLMYHAGVAIDMDYDNSANGGSGAYCVNNGSDNRACAQNALWKYFKYDYDQIKSYSRSGGNGYSSWTDNNWIAMVKAELDNQRPIMYNGSGSGGGHSFICDGYRSDNYFHFNWGWSGSNDGFYTLSNLKPGSGGSGGGSYEFNNGQQVIIGIVPLVSEFFTITYNGGTHATCATATQTQTTIGQSLTLPNIGNVDDKWLFLGWSDVAGSQTPNIGKPGDSYTPMRNITLHAVTVQDGYVVRFVPEIEQGSVAVVV